MKAQIGRIYIRFLTTLIFAVATFPGTVAAVEADTASITWWVHGDSHVGHRNYDGALARAIADVRALNISHFAITLGDAIDERWLDNEWGDEAKRWATYEAKMNELPHGWTYVLGNHDNVGRDTDTFGGPVAEPKWFTANVHGVRIIGVSDEHTGTSYNRQLEMSDEQKDWLRAELESDKRIPTIIMSHQSRDDRRTGDPFDWIDLTEFNICLLVAAHSHEWYFHEDVDGEGYHLLGIRDLLRNESSAFMTIEPIGRERSRIVFRFRDHSAGEWTEHALLGVEWALEVDRNP